MNIFNIIPYWIDVEKGETYLNSNWAYLKIGKDYDDVYKWAQENKDKIYFDIDERKEVGDADDSKFKFEFSIKEIENLYLMDTNSNEYRIELDIVAKIEIKRIEIPINSKK
ncbi:hypothetical protein [Clostridium sp.]|uniref:hypothetical protein n=1 Tax=Clostridium sp. TaxID=1506 RepID=UPI001A44D9DA|nr:hypothetical protein [Clostridium sp.]MBK5237091.1 hypothetical protein [Clostridium sp.]